MNPGEGFAREVLGGQDHQVRRAPIGVVDVHQVVAVIFRVRPTRRDEHGLARARVTAELVCFVVSVRRSCLRRALLKASSARSGSVVLGAA